MGVIRPRRPKNSVLRKEQDKFMDENHADQQARDNLLMEIDRREIKTQGELIDFADKYGYNKTQRDTEVVQDVIKKSKLPHDHVYDRERREMERDMKKKTQKIMHEATKKNRNEEYII
jgi:replication-associated recombination protein RarA